MNVSWRSCAAALLALALASPAAALAATLALVTDVVGDALAAGEPLRLLEELEPGREIDIAANGTVVVFYLRDGTEWTLKGPGRYRLAPKAPDAQAGAAPAKSRPASVAMRELRLRGDRLTQGGVRLRGHSLRAPVNELVLGGDVRFSWDPAGEGASYQFELVDHAGTRLFATETSDPELKLPAAIALKPGQLYSWAVRGRAGNGATAFYRVAEFRVADLATRRRIEAARPKPDAPFSERVLYAALLAEIGARSLADSERGALAPERPVGWAHGDD